jgi:hypothetical protein
MAQLGCRRDAITLTEQPSETLCPHRRSPDSYANPSGIAREVREYIPDVAGPLKVPLAAHHSLTIVRVTSTRTLTSHSTLA